MRVVFAGAFVALFVVAVWIFRNSNLVHQQFRLAATYSPPANLIAFEDGPTAGSRLSKPGYASLHAMHDSASSDIHRPVAYFPAWLAGHPWPPFAVLLFSHQLTDADSNHKLVALTLILTDLSDQSGTAIVRASVSAHSFMAFWNSDSTSPILSDLRRFRLHPGHEVVKIYAGQPDPSDRSHASIDYISGRHHRVLDIWLKPKGQIVSSVREVISTTMPSASAGMGSGAMLETHTTAGPASWESVKNDPRLKETNWYRESFAENPDKRK